MKINITTILAIYGSVLATIVFVWDIIKVAREKPRLKIEVAHHILAGPQETKHRIGIKMANVGRGTITVEASGFSLSPPSPKGNTATLYDLELPVELHDGQSHISYAKPDQIPRDRIVYGWVRDATGRTWKSKKWPLRSKGTRK